MEKVIIELLQDIREKEKKATLQGLRDAFGFDFNKPLKAVKFKDSFTATTLKSLHGIDCKLNKVAVIFCKRSWFEVAEFTDGKGEIVYGSLSPFSAISTKSEFNEMRKDGWVDVYVIAQKYAYLLNTKSRNRWRGRSDLEANTRYTYFDNDNFARGVVKYGNPRTWDNRIDIDFTEEYFDKSGYAVCLKRNELKAKAQKIRDDKKADLYKAMTNTQDMIAKAKKAIELKKIELSTRLLDCNTSKTVCDFGYKISNFSGLYGCYEAIERIEKRDKEKAFESPEDFNDSIRVIYDKLARI